MKYHTTTSTIVISLLIVLMFIFVSCFIISSLNLTSPTLMLTNKLFDTWKASDSNINIEFSSIERNLRDRVFVNDLVIEYKDKELVSFEKVEIQRGLFSFLGYLVSGNGALKINAENGSVHIPQNESGVVKEETDSNSFGLYDTFSIELPDSLFFWGIDLNLRNIDFEYGDIKIENSNLSLYFDHGFDSFNASFVLPEFAYKFNGVEFDGKNIALDIKYDNAFLLSLKLDNANIENDRLSSSIDNISSFLTLDSLNRIVPIDIPITLGFSSLFLSYDDIDLNLGALELEHRDRSLNLNTNNTAISYDEYSANINIDNGGNYGYTFRVMPKHEMLLEPANMDLIKWITK